MTSLHHVAVAVRDLRQASDFYRDVLGLRPAGELSVPSQKVRIAFFEAGASLIELVAPEAPDAPIAGFLESRGPGLHHLCMDVGDIEAEIARLRERGVSFIDEKPRPGPHGSRIAFLHPKSSGGVLIELRQK